MRTPRHPNRWRIRSTIVVAVALLATGCAADAAGPDGDTANKATSANVEGAVSTDGGATTADAAEATSGTSEVTAAPAGIPDLALVAADGQVAVVRDGGMVAPVEGLLAADGDTVIATVAGDGSTRVSWTELGSGDEIAATSLDGVLRAVATDPTGRFVALVGAEPASGATGTATAGTEVVVADPDGERFRRHYDSELLPEGFSNALGDQGLPIGLFVQEFLDPPLDDADAPRWYQVRVLDTTTGDLALPLNLRDKSQQVDEQMLGFGRTHVQSSVNGLLFTLYRGIDEQSGSNYAFVHTLGFVNGVWCLDLPDELGLEWELGALGLADSETRLLIASANGFVTEFAIADITGGELGVDEPAPRRTVASWDPGVDRTGPTMATAPGTIVIGQGTSLRWLDPATLVEVRSLTVPTPIDSIAVLDGGDVLVAGPTTMIRVDTAGEVRAEMALPAGFGGVARIAVTSSGRSD